MRRGNRQQFGLSRARRQRIAELDKVDAGLACEDARQLGQRTRRVMGNADIADAAFLLHSPQARQVRAPIDQIVDLHQVDHLGAQQLGGLPHLFDAALAARCPHLGREEGAQIGRQLR